MYNIKVLRKLARSPRWQTLYKHSKEIGSLKLFRNTEELTQLQIDFLQWLAIYNSLEKELARGECPYISRDVINDDIRTEAYLIFRHKEDKKKDKKGTKQADSSAGGVIFKRK